MCLNIIINLNDNQNNDNNNANEVSEENKIAFKRINWK
jgi:hypothetical protein